MVSSDSCTQLSFCAFWGPVIRQLSKNSAFQALCAKLVCCFSFFYVLEGLFCFFLILFLLLFLEEKLVFPKKGHSCLFFSVSLCFSLAFFTSPFHSFFLSLSRSLSLSIYLSLPLFLSPAFSCYFLSSLLVFFLVFCFLLVVVSLFISLFLCFLSLKNNIQTLNYKEFCINPFCFLDFLSCFVFNSLFLIFASSLVTCGFCSMFSSLNKDKL